MLASCISWFLLWPAPVRLPVQRAAGIQGRAIRPGAQGIRAVAQEKSDDPRLHFNAGAAAYRNQQFEEAAKQFNATLASPDLKLQGLAYYNEGNALYHLGERNPDPKKRTEAWEKALQDYQSTVKLNPQDADAKFNYEFVKKKLEELKQQQQQSQQNKQDQQTESGPATTAEPEPAAAGPTEATGPAATAASSKPSRSRSRIPPQQQQAEQQKKEQEQQQAAKQSEEQKQEQQQAQQSAGQPKDKADEKEQEAAAAQAMAQMTPEQAQQLLDAQKGEEQMLPLKPTGKPVDRSRPIKDW